MTSIKSTGNLQSALEQLGTDIENNLRCAITPVVQPLQMNLETIGIGLLIERGRHMYTSLPFGNTEFDLREY